MHKNLTPFILFFSLSWSASAGSIVESLPVAASYSAAERDLWVDNFSTWRNPSGEAINLKDLGAKCDGKTDDSAAFAAALAALAPHQGGEIIVPPGKCVCNIAINQNNVSLKGNSFSADGKNSSALVPYNISKPVIQIGNDTRLVTGIRLEGLSIDGVSPHGNGAVGLYLAGGAYRNSYTNLAIYHFNQYCLRMEAGISYPVAYNFFDKIIIQPLITANIAAVYAKYPHSGSYTAANYISNSNISGVNYGYALENDGTDLFITSTWLQCQNNHGVKFSKSGTQIPRIFAANVTIDSDDSSDALVETYDTQGMAHFFGTYNIDGKLKLSDGSLVSLSGYGSVADLTQLVYPYVYGSLSFVSGPQYSYSDKHRIYEASGSLWMQSAGNLRFSPGSGHSYHAGTFNVSGGNIVLDNNRAYQFKDSAGKVFNALAITPSNNVQIVTPASSGNIQINTNNSTGVIQALVNGVEKGQFNSTGMVIGGGTAIRKHLSMTETWDPPSMADGAVASVTLIVTGAVPGDPCTASYDRIGARDVLISCHIQSNNTARVILMNKTGAVLDLPSGTLRISVWQY